MVISPLQLKSFDLIQLSIEANENFDPDSPFSNEYSFEVAFDVLKAANKPSFKIPLSIKFKIGKNKKRCNIKRLEIKVIGYFEFDEGTPKDIIQQLVPYNSLAMLYGMIRGIVSDATGNTPGGTLILPTLNFFEIVKDKVEAVHNKVLQKTDITDKQSN